MKCVTLHKEVFQVAEVELIYKAKVKPSDRPLIKSSKDAFDILIQTWDDNRFDLVEQIKMILLNRNLKVLGIYELATGGIHATTTDIRLIFAAALKAVASNILLAHNHPSGSLEPSESDKELTKKLVKGGKLLNIDVLDHLIVCRNDYFSFADAGLL